MELSILLSCMLIIVARITDVSLGTLRTVFIVHGRRGTAFILGFFEILIWVIVVSKVVQNLSQPEYVISYAFGFASGTYVGITLERWLGVGQQVVRIFTQIGKEMGRQLRDSGYVVTEFEGQGQEGPIHLLFMEVSRRNAPNLLTMANEMDPSCFYVVDDVRSNPKRRVPFYNPTGWRAIAKKK